MADPFQAGRTLGDAIFGSTQDTYDEALGKQYKNQRALQEARRATSLALTAETMQKAREQVNAELMKRMMAGDIDAAATYAAANQQSAPTMNFRNLGDLGRPGYVEAAGLAMDSMLGDTPNIQAYNRANAYMEGKPYEPVRELGGAFVPSGVGLEDEGFTAVPTPVNAERIDAMQAKTRNDTARAGASVDAASALADVRRRTDPNRPRGGGKPQAAGDAPPVKGARKAPDGKWYVQKDGKYYRVD